MTTSRQVVTAARHWIGTPFHHMERQRGVGVDCVGLVVGVARELGILPAAFEPPPYARTPDGVLLLQSCQDRLVRIAPDLMRPGDIAVIEWGDGVPHHVGILGDYRHGGLSLIHAEGARQKRVIETRLLWTNRMRLVAAFRFPGVDA